MSKESVLDIPFSAGIDQSQRDEILSPVAGFAALENGRQTKAGGYSKRWAFAARSAVRTDATTRTAGRRMAASDGAPCVVDGTQLDAWSGAASGDVPIGRVPECTALRRPIAARAGSNFNFYWIQFDNSLVERHTQAKALVYANGYYVVIATEQRSDTTTGVNAFVLDRTTGKRVHTALLPSSEHAPNPADPGIEQIKLVVVGTDVVAIWERRGLGEIHASRLSLASAASIAAGWSPVVVLTTAYGDGYQWDACGLTTRFALAYSNTVGGLARITIRTYNPTTNSLTQIESTNCSTASATVTGVVIDGDEADALFYGRAQASYSGVVVEGRNPTSIASVTATLLQVITAGAAGAVRLALGRTATAEGYVACASFSNTTGWCTSQVRKFVVSAGVVTAPGATQAVYGWAPQCKPFKVGTTVYMEMSYDDYHATSQVLFDVTTPTANSALRPVASSAPRLQAPIYNTGLGPAHNFARVSSTLVATPAVVISSGVSSTACAIEYDFADRYMWAAVSASGTMLLSGGIPTSFDGQQIAELGFLVPPAVSATLTGVTGLTGNYEYTAIYEATDGAGNVVWSDTAPVVSATPAGNHVAVEVRTLSATMRQGADLHRVRIKIGRTLNGGGIFYTLTTLINDPSVASVTLDDDMSDVDLLRFAELYRSPNLQGAALPRHNPGCIHAWCEYNGMIVGLGDDKRTLRWTAQQVAGELVWFTDNFQQPMPEEASALFAQDGALFATGRRSAYVMSGEPASDNGTQGGLGFPRKLACDIGSIGPLTAVTALGTFFVSERGIELLTRAQSIADPPPGLFVQDIVAAFPVCTAITVDSAEGLVYFEMAEGMTDGVVTGNGRTLVFDIRLKAWISADRRTNTAGTADVPAQSAALIYTGSAWRYAWLAPNGVVHVEDRTTRLDPGAHWVRLYAETSWIHAAGLQGEQSVDRLMLLAAKATDHDLTMTVYFDYDMSTGAETKPFTAAQITALGRQWLDRELTRSTNTAIKVIVQDATPSSGVVGTGDGATWIGLAFPGIPHRGVKRTSAAQRGG